MNAGTNGTNYDDAPTDTEEEETVVEPEPEPAAVPDPPPERRKRAPAQVSHRAPVETKMIEGDPKSLDSNDATDRWPAVIDWVAKQYGLGPDAVRIMVHSIAQSPTPGNSGEENLGEISGDCVVGNEQQSAGAVLRDWIIDGFHLMRRGQMKYRLRFMHKTRPPGVGDSQICRAELVLPAPEVVVQQRRSIGEAYARAQRVAPIHMPAAPMGMGSPPPAQQLPPGSPQPLMLPPAPTSTGPTMTEELFREMFGRMMRGEPLGALPPPVAPAPPPPTIDQELERLAKLKKLFDSPPAPPPPPPPSFEQELERFTKLAKLLGLGAAPAPVHAAQAAPATAIVKATSPLDTVKEAFGILKQFDEMKESFGIGATDDDKPETPDEPAPFKIFDIPGSTIRWPHGDGLTTMEQAKQFLALNPDASFKMLGELAKIIDRSTIGQVVQQMMSRGNPVQQAAAAQAVQAGLAAAPTSNGALPPPAPTMPSPPPSAPPAGWTPPV